MTRGFCFDGLCSKSTLSMAPRSRRGPTLAGVVPHLAPVLPDLPTVPADLAPVVPDFPPVLPELFSISGDLPGLVAKPRVLCEELGRAWVVQHEVGGPGMLGEFLRQSRVLFQKLFEPGMLGDPFGEPRILRHVVRGDVCFTEPAGLRGGCGLCPARG